VLYYVRDTLACFSQHLFTGARSLPSNVRRRDVTVHTRLIAVLGLEAVFRVMQQSWAFSLAADASAQILGTAYFFCPRETQRVVAIWQSTFPLIAVAARDLRQKCDLQDCTVQISVPRPAGYTNRRNDPNES
jgi:hypothetical protein